MGFRASAGRFDAADLGAGRSPLGPLWRGRQSERLGCRPLSRWHSRCETRRGRAYDGHWRAGMVAAERQRGRWHRLPSPRRHRLDGGSCSGGLPGVATPVATASPLTWAQRSSRWSYIQAVFFSVTAYRKTSFKVASRIGRVKAPGVFALLDRAPAATIFSTRTRRRAS